MITQIEDNIIVTHTMGGMMEFEKTGIYPNKLRIKSIKFNYVWRIKVRDEIQSGILKILRVPVYHYIFDQEGFRMHPVQVGISITEWFYPVIRVVIQD